MSRMPTRDEAWALLCGHVDGANLRCHPLAVEAVMLGVPLDGLVADTIDG